MKSMDITTFCRHFHNSMYIPIRIYERGQEELIIPDMVSALDPFLKYKDELLNTSQPISYLITRQFIYYGIIRNLKNERNCIVIGPVTNILISSDFISEIMKDADISMKDTKEFTELFSGFPTLSFDRFLHLLCFIHYSVNQVSLAPEDIVDYKNRKLFFPITSEHTSQIYNAKEDQHFHNTYQFEKHYLNLVENGDLASLKKLLEAPVVITPGLVADNAIRQVKNLFIAGATLTTRAAIKGGLDMESAYLLSDVYIQKMEKLQQLEDIYNLQYQMIFDYTERVLTAKIPSGISLTVYECINYINANTNRPITVTDVAANVCKSRSFISTRFKQELGFGINDYINSRKIEEAKYLLSYTGKSISEISSYLCFSSQSYFQNVFKKKLGLTPMEYRNQKSVKDKNSKLPLPSKEI